MTSDPIAIAPARPQRIEIASRSGRLAAFASGPEGGPPLVVLHGALGSTALETGRLIRLWQNDFRVIALDLSGHGESDDGPEAVPTWDTYVADVGALLDALDLSDVRLFGFSMGGGVALAAALRFPERISRLAVHATHVQWDRADVGRMVGPMDPGTMERDHPFWARRLAETHGASRWRRRVERMIAFTRTLPASHLTDEALGDLRQPTLVSTGDADRFFDVEIAVGLFRAIPDARLWVIPGLDHPIQGVDPAAFARTVGEFLDPA